jgi:hypothetical protein
MGRIYRTPWGRMGPFIIGIIIGYIIYKCKKNPNFRLNTVISGL